MSTATIPPIKIDADIYIHFKEFAKRKGKTASALIREFIQNKVNVKNKHINPKDELNELLTNYSFKKSDVVNDMPNLDSTTYKDIIYRKLKEK